MDSNLRRQVTRFMLSGFNIRLKVTSGPSQASSRVLQQEKIRMRAILKENMANYISLERLTNVDFGKKYELPVF